MLDQENKEQGEKGVWVCKASFKFAQMQNTAQKTHTCSAQPSAGQINTSRTFQQTHTLTWLESTPGI